MVELSIDDEKVEMVDTTHSQRNMILKHQLEAEDQKNKNTWNSCCIVADRRAIRYFTQISIIAAVMLCTIYQLCTIDTCESQSVYIGLLTMLIGVLIPEPQFQVRAN